MGRFRRAWPALGVAAVAAFGVAIMVGAQRSPDETLGGATPWALGLQLVAGVGISGAGAGLIYQERRRGAGMLLLATGAAVFLEQMPLPGSAGAVLFTVGLVGGMITSALAGSAALAVSGSGLRLLDLVVAGAALVATVLVLGLLPALVFDPRATGCFSCAANLLLVYNDPGLHAALINLGLPWAALACGSLALLLIVRALTRPSLARSMSGPLLVGGAATATFGAAMFVYESRAGTPEVGPMTRALWLAQCGALLVAAMGVWLFWLRARLLRDRVASMVLQALPAPETLRAALATTLGVLALEIVFPRSGHPPVDAAGREAPPAAPGTAVAQVARQGVVIAHLRYATGVPLTPERVAQAAAGAGLALEHASLHARLRAEVADLAESRARIVEVGDAERRRLERNLHDGAQQRLIAISMALALIEGPEGDMGSVQRELHHALENLRAIAHGIHPVSLSESGLAGAVRELGEGSRVPVRMVTADDPRLSPAVDAALYRLVLDCVRLAELRGSGAPVTVQVEELADIVWLKIVTSGVHESLALPALEHATDRLAAVSGRLRVRALGDQLIVEATVPCAS